MKHVPNMLGEANINAFFGSEILQRFGGCGTVLKSPGGIECLAIFIETEGPATFAGNCSDPVGCVNIFDAIDGGKFKAGFAWVGKKLKRTSADDGVIGNSLGRFKIAFHICVLHELHVTEVSEAFATGGITGSVDACFDFNAGKVLNGVAIFTAGKAADGDAARVPIVLLGVGAQFCADPGDGLRAFGIRWLGHFFRRHALLFERGCNLFPMAEPFGDGFLREKLLKIDASHGSGFAVALKTVAFKSGRWQRGAVGDGDAK